MTESCTKYIECDSSPVTTLTQDSANTVVGTPQIRPTSVTVVAVIGTILGVIWVICNAGGFIADRWMQGNDPDPVLPYSFVAVQTTASIIDLILLTTMFVGCIGALRLKGWAWKLLMGWSALVILWTIVYGALALEFIEPTMYAMASAAPVDGVTASVDAGAVQIGFVVGLLGSAVVTCLVPACVLVVWRSPHVKEAFGIKIINVESSQIQAAVGRPKREFLDHSLSTLGAGVIFGIFLWIVIVICLLVGREIGGRGSGTSRLAGFPALFLARGVWATTFGYRDWLPKVAAVAGMLLGLGLAGYYTFDTVAHLVY